MNNPLSNKEGTTFIEFLIYITIFLILTPILLTVSINVVRQDQQHNIEKQVNADSQFVVERTYDLITEAKKVDVAGSVFDEAVGKISLVMQDDSIVVIEMNPVTNKIEITEGGTTSELSSDNAHVESLYFEKITDELNDPDIILGVNARLAISGVEEFDRVQNYVASANLEKGDFDEDDCPDYMDKFPRYPECCGDADGDNVCDELDNCIMSYNPFQEDFDEDDIGDECDSSVFIHGGGGGGGGGPGFNCSNDQQLISMFEYHPPLSSADLKQILISSSPLPDTVLNNLIDLYENSSSTLGVKHFRDIFIANAKFSEEVFQNIIDMEKLPSSHKAVIIATHELADYIPWIGVDQANEIDYQITLPEENNFINFSNPNYPLGEDGRQKTDIFIITGQDGAGITVTTKTASGSDTNILNEEGGRFVDSFKYEVVLESHVGDTYVFKVSCVNCSEPLEEITFDFGETGIIISPVTSNYETRRYTYYCPGGCAENCGDVGTGIITGNVFTDKCYKKNEDIYPEWCSRWKTFLDSDVKGPSYIGGTQEGEESLYWEKEFKIVLGTSQLEKLESIVVAGEVAYQRIAQFFCDQFGFNCLMYGNLVGGQEVELYNWNSDNWESIGSLNTTDSTSDQQTFEVIYDGGNPQRFVGGVGNHYIKARMQFHWNGVVQEGRDDAPSFMLIDYFTLHLKW